MHVLKHAGQEYEIRDFSHSAVMSASTFSPGFNLAAGCLSRTPHGRFQEYHTSTDNLDFIEPDYLADSFAKYLAVLDVLENNQKYKNTNRCASHS